MKRRRFAFALAFLAASLLALGFSFPAGAQLFPDPAGDAKGGGPDIRSVAVSDQNGVVTLAYKVVGLTEPDENSQANFIGTWIDTSGEGDSDLLFVIEKSGAGTADWCLIGKKNVCLEAPSVRFNASGDAYTVKIASSDLGGATAFNFWVRAGSVTKDGKPVAHDSGGTDWSYSMRSVKLVFGKVTTKPSPVRAGERVTITVPTRRSDGLEFAGGKETKAMVGLPTLNGKAALVDHFWMDFADGVVTVRFAVPADAKGKLLKVKVSVFSDKMSIGGLLSTYNLEGERTYRFRVA